MQFTQILDYPPVKHGLLENTRCINLVGGFNPSEKNISQLGLLFPIYGKIKNVPNHQPEMSFSLKPPFIGICSLLCLVTGRYLVR
jgi:hypothetical protein